MPAAKPTLRGGRGGSSGAGTIPWVISNTIGRGWNTGEYNASMSLDPATADQAPMDSSAKVVLRRGRARPLWFGHPWVYANAVERIDGDAAAGAAVSLVDHDGRLIGRGLYNPRSQIAVRLLTRSDEAIDAAFFRT